MPRCQWQPAMKSQSEAPADPDDAEYGVAQETPAATPRQVSATAEELSVSIAETGRQAEGLRAEVARFLDEVRAS